MSYKKTLQIICLLFITLLVILTLFSQTLADLRTPQVTLAFMSSGVVAPEAMSSGFVEAANIELIFSPADGIITEIAPRRYRSEVDSVLFAVRAEGGIIEILANDIRTVTELMPNLAVGARVSEGMPVMTTAIRDRQFIIEARFSPDQYFINAGISATIYVGENRLHGRVQQVFPEGGRLVALIELVETGVLSGGELARVIVHGPSDHYPHIIPRSALREDRYGYFILLAEAEPRLFGMNYRTQSMRVEVLARDDRHVAILFDQFEGSNTPIVINSDSPVYAGSRIRPVNEGGFFEAR